MARLFAATAEEEIFVKTFLTSQPWVCPEGVFKLSKAEGAGARGKDATAGYYDPPINRTIYVTHASHTGADFNNPTPGQLDWSQLQSNHQTAVSRMNAGGTMTITRRDYFQYNNGYGSDQSTISASSVIGGSASSRFSGGWKFSGPVTYPDFAFAYVDYQERGAFNPGTPATTGASATGFNRVFPGSTGNVAVTPTVYSDVPVTPNQSYSISVPSGGFITITYSK